MKKLCAMLFLLFLLPAIAQAAPHRVVDVADGDTVTIEPVHGGARAKVRLHGIDCPEMGQPYGQAAKAYVVKTALYKTVDVQVTPQGKDRYGRVVAVIEIPGVGILQELLLKEGLAWVWPQYCKDCKAWEAMQAKARAQGKGLWAGNKPIEPWVWRKRK